MVGCDGGDGETLSAKQRNRAAHMGSTGDQQDVLDTPRLKKCPRELRVFTGGAALGLAQHRCVRNANFPQLLRHQQRFRAATRQGTAGQNDQWRFFCVVERRAAPQSISGMIQVTAQAIARLRGRATQNHDRLRGRELFIGKRRIGTFERPR